MNNNWDDENPQQFGPDAGEENTQHPRWRRITSEDAAESDATGETETVGSAVEPDEKQSLTARARSRFPSRITRRKHLDEKLGKTQNVIETLASGQAEDAAEKPAERQAEDQVGGQENDHADKSSSDNAASPQTPEVIDHAVEEDSPNTDISTDHDTPSAAPILATAASSAPPEVAEITPTQTLQPDENPRGWENLIVDSYQADSDAAEKTTTELNQSAGENAPWQPIPGSAGADLSPNNEYPNEDSAGASEMAQNQKPQAKAKTKKQRPRWQRALIWFLWIVLIGIILGTLFFIISFLIIKIPPVDGAVRVQRTSVTYADGQTEIGSLSEVDRTIIDTKTLPDYVGKAVVASEDRTFYENSGIDLKGIVRAAWNNIQGKPRQGASTLTQQYVENYYKGSTKGYIGKYREAILALKINQSQSKEEILGNYLNTIYFGRRAYGIEAAAQAYFGKSAKELTLSESAMIAGIIPAPSAWDPAKRPEKAKQRWERVLKLMKEDGFITEAQANEAKFPEKFHSSKRARRAGNSGYILDQVTAELKEKAGMKAFDLSASGYKIVTTLDPDRMKMMEDAVNTMPKGSPNLHVGMISVDNKTGGIIAEYAGSDYNKSQRNNVIDDVLQGGSTFKPFTLVAALETGKYNIYSRFSGKSPQTFMVGGKPYTAKNYDNTSYGVVDMRYSTARSINTTYLHLNEKIGPEKTKDMAIKLGLPGNTLGLGNELSNALGSASPHVVDLAQAYSTIANYGNRMPVHLVAKVLSPEGEVVYSAPTAGKQVVESEVIKKAIPALRAVFQSGGTGVGGHIRGYDIIGKTGTSSNNRSALFVGLIPQWTTIVGMYQTGPHGEAETISPIGGVTSVTGSSIPALVWRNYMTKALEGVEAEKFESSNKQEISNNSSPEATQPKAKETENNDSEKAEEESKSDSKQPQSGDGKQKAKPGDEGTKKATEQSGEKAGKSEKLGENSGKKPEKAKKVNVKRDNVKKPDTKKVNVKKTDGGN